MRQHSKFSPAMLLAACALVASAALPARDASAQGLFDFLFGGASQKQQQQQQRRGTPPPEANFFADPFGLNTPAAPPPPPQRSVGGSGPAFCVRTCDGKYFPLARSAASPALMCQSFCPATTTKVFLGSNIDSASTNAGERYADMENAYAYRKALRADCTCNGRDPAGLAPVDLSLDTSLRAGDVIATNSGLVAYSGARTGNGQTAEFTPVASYPGLTSDVRSRLGEMKVAPVAAEMVNEDAPMAESSRDVAPAATSIPKSAPASAAARGKRAEID